jgi:hypothetical protein
MKSGLAICFVSSLLSVFSFSIRSSADDSVTVNLKCGGLVRGELVERVPNQKLVLKLATDEISDGLGRKGDVHWRRTSGLEHGVVVGMRKEA